MKTGSKILFFIIQLLILSLSAFADNGLIVSGKITNETGQPLVAVNVFEVGVNNQVQTNSKGEYSINIQHDNAIVRFSYSGYEMQEVRVFRTANKNVTMKPAAKESNLQTKNLPEDPPTVTGTSNANEGRENSFQNATMRPSSAFSVEVDGASYSNIYRYGQNAEMPSDKMVRIEEMINYFHYDYPKPEPGAAHPFTITTELSQCPWNRQHKLLLIGLQGKEIPAEKLPASNLVFLVDASGSMADAAKLPLVKASLKLLAQQLRSQDLVTVVAYAGNAGLTLPPTPGSKKATIEKAVDELQPAGYTAGAAGIKMAYRIAKQNFIKGGNNRIILCTDGDFNVGISSNEAIDSLIEAERKTGVLLSVLGFGNSNRQQAKMKRWAEIGNGNHNFISGLNEAKRLFVNEFASTMYTIAKDVKPVVNFNPSKVQAYHLLGYDTKSGSKPGNKDDLIEEGELGSGHTVTALYEIIPVGIKDLYTDTTGLSKFKSPDQALHTGSGELATIDIAYKKPENDEQQKLSVVAKEMTLPLESASTNFRFAAAVAEFGLLLRESDYKQKASYKDVITLAKTALGKNEGGARSEFVTLVENIKRIDKQEGRFRIPDF